MWTAYRTTILALLRLVSRRGSFKLGMGGVVIKYINKRCKIKLGCCSDFLIFIKE